MTIWNFINSQNGYLDNRRCTGGEIHGPELNLDQVTRHASILLYICRISCHMRFLCCIHYFMFFLLVFLQCSVSCLLKVSCVSCNLVMFSALIAYNYVCVFCSLFSYFLDVCFCASCYSLCVCAFVFCSLISYKISAFCFLNQYEYSWSFGVL